MLARDYAQGLYELTRKSDLRSQGVGLADRLKEVLERRGHLRLLPHILSEYEKLAAGAQRLEKHKQETPEQAQTRMLTELYRKLTA